MPYLLDSTTTIEESQSERELLARFFPAKVLREFAKAPSSSLTHFEYFRLCLSAHYLTCGTPVPTDVDNQIRFKLWPAQLSLDVALEMAQLVLESRKWDYKLVSTRFVYGTSEWQGETLDGHLGEWFTFSCAAYCALKQYTDPAAQQKRNEILDQIADEVRRHSEIFGSLWRAYDGLGCLKASASIAHNFGDLDRVMDLWELSVDDPLRLNFYKLAITPFDSNRNLRYLGRLWVAGELYKAPIGGSSMALENHRHFALRKPRCLRQERAFLIPTGPFFDHWGRIIGRGLISHKGDPTEGLLEVVEALRYGWERLPKTVGYGRALHGILEACPQLQSTVSSHLKSEDLRSVVELSKENFEKTWHEGSLKQMDDIPSRAE